MAMPTLLKMPEYSKDLHPQEKSTAEKKVNISEPTKNTDYKTQKIPGQPKKVNKLKNTPHKELTTQTDK